MVSKEQHLAKGLGIFYLSKNESRPLDKKSLRIRQSGKNRVSSGQEKYRASPVGRTIGPARSFAMKTLNIWIQFLDNDVSTI